MSRGWVLLALAAATLSSPLLTATSCPARALITACVLLLAPGAAVLGFSRRHDTLTELVITLVISLTVDVLASVTALTVLQYSFDALFVVLALTAAPIIGWRAARELSASRRDHAAA